MLHLLAKDATVLEFGSNTAHKTYCLSDLTKFITLIDCLDLKDEIHRLWRFKEEGRDYEFIKDDITKFNKHSNNLKYDLILQYNILQLDSITDEDRLNILTNMRELLKDDGLVMFTMPFTPHKNFHNSREHLPEKLPELIEQSGLKIVECGQFIGGKDLVEPYDWLYFWCIKVKNKVDRIYDLRIKENKIGDKDIVPIVQKTVDVLEKNKFKYWLASGTCLGFIREGKAIDRDLDIDIEIELDYLKDNTEILDKLVSDMETNGFELNRKFARNKTYTVLGFYDKVNDIHIDISIMYDNVKEGILVCFTEVCDIYIKKEYVKDLETGLFGFKYPNPVLEYLEFRYGKNWKIPTTKSIWTEYAFNILK